MKSTDVGKMLSTDEVVWLYRVITKILMRQFAKCDGFSAKPIETTTTLFIIIITTIITIINMLYYNCRQTTTTHLYIVQYKKTVLSQGNRAMPQLFFSV